MKHAFPILLMLCLLAGCTPQGNRPTESSPYASQMRSAYLLYWGAYYDEEGLPQHVLSLDCYSEGLTLSEEGIIRGTGTNLYISDLFVPDSLTSLPAGTYTSDSTGAAFTFLPGRRFEQQFDGAYLLAVTDDQLTAYTLLTKGQLTVSYENNEAVFHFEGTTSDKKAYTADFRGRFYRQDRSSKLRSF